MRTVTLRKANKTQLGFTLPAELSKPLERLLGHQFAPEFTDDGVLYRYVGPPTAGPVPAEPVATPTWAEEVTA